MGVFRMPSLGADMEAGTLVEWLKQPGEGVKSGDIIAVVETQKGAIEIEVFETGTIQSILIPAGRTVPVGAEMAVIASPAPAAGSMPTAPMAPPPTPEATPVAIPVAKAVLAPTAPLGGARPASPAARHFAAKHGIDLAGIDGSGPDGAIVYVDVEKAWQARQTVAAIPAAPPKAAVVPDSATAMRRAIAAAMTRSKREIPHYYLGHAVDVTATLAWLATNNAGRRPEERIVFGAMLLRALAASLGDYPEFNGFHRDGRFAPSDRIHVGMAVALRQGGLVAPAIHDADKLSLDRLMAAMRDLVNRVRAGRFRGSELADPTITLTSLGELGVDWVLPVIYPPQVAILGAGSPAERSSIVEGRVTVRKICQLTLAADHRASDGHRGALFLRAIAKRLENPVQP